MKKTALIRKTPLKSGSPLKRVTAWPAPTTARSQIHQNQAVQRHQPKRRPATSGVPAKVRKALALRSDGVCEIGQQGCTGRATEAAHRVKVGMGGRKGSAAAAHHVLSNLLHLDHNCHQILCHANPTAAYSAGWMLREHQSPALEPCLYRGAVRWLTDDGLVLSTNPHNAEEATHA